MIAATVVPLAVGVFRRLGDKMLAATVSEPAAA